MCDRTIFCVNLLGFDFHGNFNKIGNDNLYSFIHETWKSKCIDRSIQFLITRSNIFILREEAFVMTDCNFTVCFTVKALLFSFYKRTLRVTRLHMFLLKMYILGISVLTKLVVISLFQLQNSYKQAY